MGVIHVEMFSKGPLERVVLEVQRFPAERHLRREQVLAQVHARHARRGRERARHPQPAVLAQLFPGELVCVDRARFIRDERRDRRGELRPEPAPRQHQHLELLQRHE